MVSRSLACLSCFMRWGYRMLFLICHSASALSVAIWVCSFIKAAAILASLALFMLLLRVLLRSRGCSYP